MVHQINVNDDDYPFLSAREHLHPPPSAQIGFGKIYETKHLKRFPFLTLHSLRDTASSCVLFTSTNSVGPRAHTPGTVDLGRSEKNMHSVIFYFIFIFKNIVPPISTAEGGRLIAIPSKRLFIFENVFDEHTNRPKRLHPRKTGKKICRGGEACHKARFFSS